MKLQSTYVDINDLNKLLPEEKEILEILYDQWEHFKNLKNWQEADKIRSKLIMWDRNIVNDNIWHPHFENNLNRQKRAFLRMIKYNVPIYPWELSDVL